MTGNDDSYFMTHTGGLERVAHAFPLSFYWTPWRVQELVSWHRSAEVLLRLLSR